MDFAKLIAKIDSIESKQSLNEGWEDMMKAVDKEGKHKEKEKGTGKFDKKEVSTGTVYTRKSSTFDDGGDDSDTKKAKKDARKAKKDKTDESVEEELDEGSGDGDSIGALPKQTSPEQPYEVPFGSNTNLVFARGKRSGLHYAMMQGMLSDPWYFKFNGKVYSLSDNGDGVPKEVNKAVEEGYSTSQVFEEWGAGMDAVENTSVERALAELQKHAPDAKVGPGYIKAGNTEVSISRDDKVSLAELNKAVRTLKGVSVNPLRSVREEEDVDMEEGIEDRIKDLDPKNPVNQPAVQRKAKAGDVAANDTMNRLRTLAGQPVKESEAVEEEDDVEEGAGVMHFKAQKAKADGKDSFKLGDKTYPVKESTAPGQEDWIKSNKDKFIKQYGKTKGEEVLYATAHKRSKQLKESLQFEECYDQAMSQQSQQESGMNISSNLDTKTGNKSLTVTAQGAAAEQLAQILKLSGMQAQAHEEPMDHAMEEEYANTPEPVIQGVEVQMQQGNDLNRPKQSYPKVAGGDNPMAMAEAAELAAIEKRLMEELDSIKIVSKKTTSRDAKGAKGAKGAKPDFLDINKNGNKKKPMKKAIADTKKKGK